MAIKQLTVFVENRKGTMVSVTETLSENDVNIRALSIAETQDFGILRLIVNEEEKAMKALEEKDYLVKAIDVVGVKIGDESIYADYVLLGVGRNGSEWLRSVLRKHRIKFTNNRVDIMLRHLPPQLYTILTNSTQFYTLQIRLHANLEFICNHIMPQPIILQIILTNILNGCFLFVHSPALF